MEASGQDATDASSIKPVSSLRSKFENLGHGQPAAQSRANPTRPQVPFLAQDTLAHVPVRKSLDLPRPFTHVPAPSTSIISDARTPQPRSRRATPSKPRPLSVSYASPSKPSPPTVTIDSPRSPPHVDVALAAPTPTKPTIVRPVTPSSNRRSSSGGSARHGDTPGRATTPGLEARGPAYLQEPHVSDDGLIKARTPPPEDQKPKGRHTAVPPPVNRTGKPKAPPPKSSRGLVHDAVRLAPSNGIEAADEKVSPFSTPPSSAEGTPHEISPPSNLAHTLRRPPSMPGRESYFMPPPMHHLVRDRKIANIPTLADRSLTLPLHTSNHSGLGILSSSSEDSPPPGLPPRRAETTQSGRTSPLRQQRIPARRSQDFPRSPVMGGHEAFPQHAPSSKRTTQSALMQGFDRSPVMTYTPRPAAPFTPVPHRSIEARRDSTPPVTRAESRPDDHEDAPIPSAVGSFVAASDYPDSSRANRRPPRLQHRPWEIATGYDTRLMAVCGEYVCTTGHITKAWSLRTGEELLSLSHGENGENIRGTSVAWKPAKDVADEGKRLWLGTNTGDVLEVDVAAKQIVHTNHNAHPRREIIKMYRHASDMWSLDDDGTLNVWPPDVSGAPSLESKSTTFRVPRGHTCSLLAGKHLWFATGKEIRVFDPTAVSETAFQVLQKPLCQTNLGDITSGTTISSKPDLIYFGHSDGKVTVYNKHDFSCLGAITVSVYKIGAMAGVGDYLWAGYNTGMAHVYDTSSTPWRVLKDWRAHDNPVCSIVTDQSSLWKMDRFQVITLGTDNFVKIWDGMLEEDWLQAYMSDHDEDFCTFEEVTASVITWNAGATKPSHLRANDRDAQFLRGYMSTQDSPDIFVFGFQELIDLEDKKTTAKNFFKSKTKNASEPEHMGHEYRAWRDHLGRCLEEFMPSNSPYVLLHTASMVGLFTCVFVKTSLRPRIKSVNPAEIKRGMGGTYGNKGALILRLTIDDSSLCFVNCHLAAGQTHTVGRNNDVAAILESECLPPSTLEDTFVGGGDGSMILDHEICILNGDLNYRIDTMTRDAVVKAVRDGNLTRCLDRDQLVLSRKRNPGFRLRAFQELPINFAPTYKYNVGSDEYDTSEKKRAPAWCDRVLFRGLGRVKCDEYRRWELRVSDHRPVSGRFRLRVKHVDAAKRTHVWQKTQVEFDRVRGRIAHDVRLDYMTNVFGLPKQEALRLLAA